MAVLELSSQSVPYVQSIRLKGVVVKDLDKDICKVVGSNPCVVNHELGTVVK